MAKMKITILDRVVGYFNPRAAVKQVRERQLMQRFFEGASRAPRTEGWKRPATSPNAANYGALAILRNTVRNLTRNNPWMSKAILSLQVNLIGEGIKITLRDTTKNLSNEKKIKELWWNFAHTKACDYENRLDFFALQSLAARCLVESGEFLIRRRALRYIDDKTVPFELQLLEPDFLDDTKDGPTENGGKIVQGIEYNASGKRVAYHLYEDHPGDLFTFNNFKSNRILAKNIIHVFNPVRIGQSRGYSWVSAVVARLQEFDQYEDAQLVKQKLSAAWSAFVTDTNPVGTPTQLDANQPLDYDPAQFEYLQNGTIQFLPNGKQITFSNPPSIEGYGEFSKNTLRGTAAGAGTTYEAISGDMSDVNFSSGRMGWLEMHRMITSVQQHVLIGQMVQGVYKWFQEAAEILGYNFSNIEVKYVKPRREMINPTEEIKAAKEAVRSGFTSLSRVITEMGYDPEEIMAEQEQDYKLIDKLKLVVESDGRVPVSGGPGRKEGEAKNTN